MQQNRHYKWLVVFLLWLICVLNYADRQAVFAVFSVLEKEFGFNKKQLGLIGSSFMIVYASLSPLAGAISDHFNRKRIIIFGLCTWSLFTGFTSFCSQLWHFVFVRGAEGLGETFYFPASSTVISDYHNPQTRSRALGFHHTGTYVGTIVGGVLTGLLAQHFGWQMPFLVLGGAGIGLACVLLVFLQEPQRTGGHVNLLPLKIFVPELLKNPAALTLVFVFFLANFVSLPFYAWLPIFVAEKFNKDVAESAITGTIYIQLSSCIGALIGGYLADIWKMKIGAGRVWTQAIGILFYAPFMYLMGSTEDYLTFKIGMCCLGLFKGLYDANVWAVFYDVVNVTRRSTLCGLANTLAWLGGSLSVFLVGYVVDAKYLTMGEAFQYLPALNILMGFLLFLVGLSAVLSDTASVPFARSSGEDLQ